MNRGRGGIKVVGDLKEWWYGQFGCSVFKVIRNA